MPNLSRTRIAVRRTSPINGEVVGSFANMDAAFRALAGTVSEITNGERRSIRAALRAGRNDVRDSRGFYWNAVSEVIAFAETAGHAAMAAAFPVVAWTDLTFGVELEVTARASVVAMDHITNLRNVLAAFPDWRVVRDGSVQNGAEVVSPILSGEAGLIALEQICHLIKAAGYNADRSCGMHVHVGIRGYTVEQIANVCRLFKANEAHFDSIVAPSRQNNHYCQSHTNLSVPARANSIASLARRFNGGFDAIRHYTPYRYRKLNLQSYAIHGTMEFRQHQGTVEANRAVNWVRLITGFAASGMNGNTSALPFDQFAALAGVGAGFIASRRARFAANAAAVAA